MLMVSSVGMTLLSVAIGLFFALYAFKTGSLIDSISTTTSRTTTSQAIKISGVTSCAGFLAQAILWCISLWDLEANNGLGTSKSINLLLASFTAEVVTVMGIIHLFRTSANNFKAQKKQYQASSADSFTKGQAVAKGSSGNDRIELGTLGEASHTGETTRQGTAQPGNEEIFVEATSFELDLGAHLDTSVTIHSTGGDSLLLA